MVRLLEPLEANVKKRLVKSPKVYLRDSGTVHALLGIRTRDEQTAPPWDAIIRTGRWDVVHAYDTSLPGWLVLVYTDSDEMKV